MKKILIIFSALITFGVSCKKIDHDVITENGDQTITKTMSKLSNRESCTPENPNNPMDDVGKQHNQAVEFTAQQVNIYDEANVQSAIDITNQHTIGLYPNTSLYITSKDQLESLMHGATSNMSSFTNALEISDKAKGYLSQLFTALLDTPGISEYCDMKIRIVAIEQAITADGSINNLEKTELFSATSIARYSYFYWSNSSAYGEGSIGRGGNPVAQKGKFLKWLKAGLTTVADVAGGIAGGAAGGKAAEGTGIEPKYLVAAGAVVGGTSASVGMAGLVDKVAGWFGG